MASLPKKDVFRTELVRDTSNKLVEVNIIESTMIGAFDGKTNLNPFAGQDNTNMDETQPKWIPAECERVESGRNNTHIILGRDRQHSIASGYGGKGWTRAGAIDIVVGLQGWSPAEGGEVDSFGSFLPGNADRSFGSMTNHLPGDAARIYISQRADIDDYFDICDGGVGRSIADSAIGIKADSVRIMARKGIKLVTQNNPPGRTSINGSTTQTYGIDLIAGNWDIDDGTTFGRTLPGLDSDEIPYLQPIPKGIHLETLLKNMATRIEKLNGVASAIIMHMPSVIACIQSPRMVPAPTPTGFIPAFLPEGLPYSVELKAMLPALARYAWDFQIQRIALTAMKRDYLSPGGPYYINSRHNRTN